MDLSLHPLTLEECRESNVLKKNLISELPDDILIHILSFLLMKEAGRTSVLSKRWKHVWAYIPNLNFDPCETLDVETAEEEERLYCSWVDKVISLHKAPTVDEFVIECNLRVGREETLDNWARFAVEKRVKRLELDIAPEVGNGSPVSYTFPSLPLCSSLIDLYLGYVNVSGEVLEKLLGDCFTLEYLSIKGSKSLIDWKVTGPSPNLKILRIQNCFKIRHLEISAPNLEYFQYRGPKISPPFKSTPKLVEVFIGGQYASDVISNFLDFSSVAPQIEVLSIQPIYQITTVGEVFPIFATLKTLDIKMDPSSDVQLFGLRFLLKACPVLHKFVLTFEEALVEVRMTEMTRNVEVCPHNQLKILEIVEFVGWKLYTAFVMYLIESAVSLQKMIIQPTVKPISWEDCVYGRRDSAIKQAELLRSKLNPGTVYQIRD